MNATRRGLLAAPLALAMPRLARANTPVDRVARIIVGFPAGGTVDITARLLAERLRGVWAPQVIVDNRVGAAGRLALEEAARSAPDGTTMVITPASMMVINPHLYGNRLRYDPVADFAPVSPVTTYPFGLATGPGASGVTDLAGLVAFAKSKGGLNYASPAAGSMPHFAGVMLSRAVGVEFVHVPYRGAAPAITDAIAGQIPATINVIGDLTEHHQRGLLKILATTSPTRLARLPDVPTFTELGFPTLTFDEWFGIFLPARTPQTMVSQLNMQIAQAVNEPGYRENMEKRELQPYHMLAADFAARMNAETGVWGPVVQQSGFRPEE
ncbi:hypothetical protein IAI18_18830 [Acetobacteraceae bacterium H6797]|nr:hypothetical protein [Acetobacteraceae bacterium H6797]